MLLNEVLDPAAWLAETHYGTLGFEAGGHWYHAAELTSTQFTKSGAILTARTLDPLQRELIVQVHFLAPGIVRISSRPSEPTGVTRMAVAVATDSGEQAPEDGVYASGLPGVDEHNLYPVRYAQATYEAATAVKPDFVTFARSAYVGSTPYLRLTWPGDQSVDWSRSNGLPAQIPAMLSGAMSGIPNYAPDVAGYYDPDGGPLNLEAEKELWMRWVELGALSPTFRDMLGARHAQNVNLWTDAETLGHFRTYARLHNSLVPYIYSVAREASERGYPIMRHLFLDYPDDPNTYTLDDQYLVGAALLVCPVVTPAARDRSCYLPAGDWVDFWTGEMYRGAGYATLPALLERIPLLVRAGAVLPTAAPRSRPSLVRARQAMT